MGNSQNPKKQIIKNDMQSSQPIQQIPIKQENPIKQKQKEENDLETEFFKFLANGDRKNKWKTYFKINKITSMADLLSSYQMSETTKTGKRLNEAEKQILNNYLLRQSKEEAITINYKTTQDLKRLKYIESFDQLKNVSLDQSKKDSTENQIRNILIVGITGQGKSTFINSFVTAIEREFSPRVKGKEIILDYFQIIKVKDLQAQSDTNEVTSYTFTIDNLTINLIDTPGLADTEGLQKDQERITQISTYIQKQLHQKEQKLHAILFVSQSSTQYEVIDGNPSLLQLSMLSILKLFGKKMCAFTKHCLTFSDFTATSTQNFESRDSIFYSVKEEQILINQRQPDQQENIMETFNEDQFNTINQTQNIKEQKNQEEFYFQFQNSVFRATKQGFIENIHFQKNLVSYKKLFDFIQNESNKGFNLEDTVQVIEQRTQIRNELGGLQVTLQQLIKFLKSVEENTRKLEIYLNKIEDSKMFESVIFLIEWKQNFIIKNKKKAYSTNCNKCNKTCCKACDSKILDHCIEMIEKNVKGEKSIICSRCGHDIQFHTQQEYFWQPVEVKKTIIDENLKQENDNAKEKSAKINKLLKEQEIIRDDTKEQIKNIMIKMKDCLQGLLSSALYRLDILDVEAYDFVLKFYPDYKKALEEFKCMDELKVTTKIREKMKQDKLMASKTLLSVETKQFQAKQFGRS